MYWHRTPRWLTWLYPQLIWHKDRDQKKLYLTFDDGPVPEVTPWVLDALDNYNAKATFFCVGENIQKNPELYKEISTQGHAVGNHTYNHINGWKTSTANYLKNVRQCHDRMHPDIYPQLSKPLMRPPYGRIKRAQIRKLLPEYQIVMWDVLSGDFDQTINPEDCLKASIDASQPGSIVIFHDSLKAQQSLTYILPRFLKYFATKGFPSLLYDIASDHINCFSHPGAIERFGPAHPMGQTGRAAVSTNGGPADGKCSIGRTQ